MLYRRRTAGPERHPGKAADRLIGWGVVGSVPAGSADYADSHEEQQRVDRR
jgi:hypothetical protein